MTLKQLLVEIRACEDAREWVGDKTIEEAVAQCPRGDWMLWIGENIGVDVQPLTLAKGHCANTVRHLMKDERSIHSVDTAIAFGEGRATIEELEKAYSAAHAAYDAYSATHAAYAAAAASAAAASAAAYAAATAAADADSDAAYAAADAAFYAAADAYADAYAAAYADAYAAAAAFYAAADAYADAYAAAYADAYAAADAAAYAAKKANQKLTADICHKYIGDAIIQKVNELLK